MRRQPEKAVERDIMRALETLGFDVVKMSQPQRAICTPGTPDLYARHPAWSLRLWVEVKSARGYVSPHQRAWHESERACGGIVITAWSVADLIAGLRAAGAPIEG